MKHKKILAKIVSFMLAMCMMVGGISINAFAGSGLYPWDRTVPYGSTFHIFADDQNDKTQYGDDIYDSETLGTYSFNDARTHRFRIKFDFTRSNQDDGPINSPVKVTIKVTNASNGQVLINNKVAEPNSGSFNGSFDSGWVTGVSSGDKVKVWVDASTATGYSGNGKFRTVYFSDFQIYYD